MNNNKVQNIYGEGKPSFLDKVYTEVLILVETIRYKVEKYAFRKTTYL